VLTALTAFTGDDILPLADAKDQVGITADDTTQDNLVGSIRDQAIDWAEGYCGKSLQSRQFLWTVDQFSSVMALPIGPVSAANSVKYYDTDETDTTIDAADYYLGNDKLSAAIDTTWPYADGRPGGVRITFTAGYETAADIPLYLLAAVRLAMTAMFENRSNPDLAGAMRAADQYRDLF
jgi:uncharacterized phiE125 gp8 family phage protein